MKQITIIRKKVATMANQLKKLGLTLSEAFKKAWQLIKGQTITTKVKGVTAGRGQRILERLTHYCPEQIIVQLEREPHNLYDSNAVAVNVGIVAKGIVKVGYLPAPLAKVASGLLDKGIVIDAAYGQIKGKYERHMNYGIEIQLSI